MTSTRNPSNQHPSDQSHTMRSQTFSGARKGSASPVSSNGLTAGVGHRIASKRASRSTNASASESRKASARITPGEVFGALVWRPVSLTVLLTALLLWSSTASADEPGVTSTADTFKIGVGARIGGYQFREPTSDGVAWEGCRMDGAGLFATTTFLTHGFAELGFDFYAANDPSENHGMDRLSLISTVAAGFRMFPDWWVSPNIHLGGGVEWTEIEFSDGHTIDENWAPVAFIGLGLDINATENLHMGASLRILAMALPPHTSSASNHAEVGHGGAGDHGDEASLGHTLEMTPAGQLQFFLRYDVGM